MSLLRQIQHMLEGNDRATGINLERCVIGPSRTAQLVEQAGPGTATLTENGGTFLQAQAQELRLAIYFPDAVIAALEADDPRTRLNERNISPLISFIEEIAHAVHAGYLFLQGQRDFSSEASLCNLEAQAKVDTSLVLTGLAALLVGGPLPPDLRTWLDDQLFDEGHRHFPPGQLRERYRRAEEMAWEFLQLLRATPLSTRRALLRTFRRSSWTDKQALLASSPPN